MVEGTTRLKAARPLLMQGSHVGIALMVADDVSTIAEWNQNLDFTARLGTPGEAHTFEQRQKFFDENSQVTADSVEFAILELGSSRLVGFGGLFDMRRALVGTLFVGIGDAADRGRGFGSEASRLICEYGFFFRNLYGIKVEVHDYNQGAKRVYERLGFKLAGRVRGANLLNNRRYDEIIMDLLRDELELKHVSAFRHLEIAAGKLLPA